MTVDLRISGQAELRKVARLLREADRKDLTKELRAGQRKAFSGLGKDVAASAETTLPKRGGYNQVMARDVKVDIRVTLGRAAVKAVVYARGKKEMRDVAKVNAGRLRRPIFARGPRKGWRWVKVDQRVTPRFVDRVIDELPDEVLAESVQAIDRVIAKVTAG